MYGRKGTDYIKEVVGQYNKELHRHKEIGAEEGNNSYQSPKLIELRQAIRGIQVSENRREQIRDVILMILSGGSVMVSLGFTVFDPNMSTLVRTLFFTLNTGVIILNATALGLTSKAGVRYREEKRVYLSGQV